MDMIIRPVRILEDGSAVELDWKNPDDGRYIKQAIGLYVFKHLRKLLRERGISFSRPGEPFEFSLTGFKSVSHKRIENWNEGPLLVHDHSDTAGLTKVGRVCLRAEKVLGILKPRLYRDSADHGVPVLQFPSAAQTLHTTMLAAGLPSWFTTEGIPCEPLRPPIQCSQIARKIRLVPGYSHAQMFNTGWKAGPNLDGPRVYDSYFAGTVLYNNLPVVLHRISCINEMRRAGCRGSKVKWTVRTQSWPEYMRVGIRRTKTAPSPWGYGAVCFRDFEVLMGGAILIKPDTTFCRGWPDLFHPDNDLYVRCRIDFADLRDIIADVACNWNSDRYRTMRERGWEFVEKCHDLDLTADHLADVFHYFEGLA